MIMIDASNNSSGMGSGNPEPAPQSSGTSPCSTAPGAHRQPSAADVSEKSSPSLPASGGQSVLAQLQKSRPVARRETAADALDTEATSGRLSRTTVNFWLDTALLVVFVSLGVTAVIVQFVFPPGVAARGWTLWGMSYGRWTALQFGELCLLGVGILVHVMLHWTWVCSVITRRILKMRDLPDDGIRTVYGVGFLILLLLTSAAVVAAAMFSIRDPGL